MIWEKFFGIAHGKQEAFTGLLEACLSFNKMSPKISEEL